MFCPGDAFVTVVELLIARSARSTLTVNLQDADCAEVSVDVQETIVDPTGNSEPDGGAQTATTPGQLSVADGAGYDTGTPLAEVPATVTSAGQVI